jgi:hypothetical protein
LYLTQFLKHNEPFSGLVDKFTLKIQIWKKSRYKTMGVWIFHITMVTWSALVSSLNHIYLSNLLPTNCESEHKKSVNIKMTFAIQYNTQNAIQT